MPRNVFPRQVVVSIGSTEVHCSLLRIRTRLCFAVFRCGCTISSCGLISYIHPYFSGFLHWHWGNCIIGPELYGANWLGQTTANTTKSECCAYFLGLTPKLKQCLCGICLTNQQFFLWRVRARHLFFPQLGRRTTIKQHGLVRNRNLLGHNDNILFFVFVIKKKQIGENFDHLYHKSFVF